MTAPEIPLSGYDITRIYTTHLELTAKKPDDDVEEHGALRFGWSWRWLERQERSFEVRISVAIEPTADRPEFIASNVVGRFRQVDENPHVSIVDFSGVQAVAILLPYAREFLSSLTTNSVFGTYYLPTLNVNVLMKDMNVTGVIVPQLAAKPHVKSPHKGRVPQT